MNLARSLKTNFITNTIKCGNINESCTKLLTQLRRKSVQAAAVSGAVDVDKIDAPQASSEERTTHFGFQKVKESEKDQKGEHQNNIRL